MGFKHYCSLNHSNKQPYLNVYIPMQPLEISNLQRKTTQIQWATLKMKCTHCIGIASFVLVMDQIFSQQFKPSPKKSLFAKIYIIKPINK